MLGLKLQLFSDDSTDPVEKNYLDEITKLKTQIGSMVSSEDYNRVVEEHKKLTQEFINKKEQPVSVVKTKADKHKELYNTHLIINEITKSQDPRREKELLKTFLDQRDLSIELLGIDTMVGLNLQGNGVITKEKADEIAEGIKELIKEADEYDLSVVEANRKTKIIRESR